MTTAHARSTSSLFDRKSSLNTCNINYVDMDDILNPTLILLTFVVVLGGQLFKLYNQRKRRVTAAVLDRNLYFSKLTEGCMEITKKVEELERENDEMANDLGELGISVNFEKYDIHAAALEQRLRTILVHLKQERLQFIQDEIDVLKISLGFENHDDQLLLNGLEPKIKQLEDELDNLRSQLNSISQPASPLRINEMDPKLTDFIEQHMKDLTVDSVKLIYETLLKIKAYSANQSLDDYLRRIESKPNYEAKLVGLDVNRKMVEERLAARKDMYRTELDSFNQTRIEHLFKNTGAQGLLNELRAKNNAAERLIENTRKDAELKKENTNISSSVH